MIFDIFLTTIISIIWLTSFTLIIFIGNHFKNKPLGLQTILDLTRLDWCIFTTCTLFNFYIILLITFSSKNPNEFVLMSISSIFVILRMLVLASILVNFIIKSLLIFQPGVLDDVSDTSAVFWSRLSTFALAILAIFLNLAKENSGSHPLMILMSKGKYSKR